MPDQPVVVSMTNAERLEGKYSKANLRRAIEGLNRDGVVYLANIVDTEHVEQLRLHMLEEAKILKAQKGEDASKYNHGVATNFIQAPPLTTRSLFFEDVYANDFVHQVVCSYIGPRPAWTFITGNNANKRTTERQTVHKDSSYIHPLAPSIVIANFSIERVLTCERIYGILAGFARYYHTRRSDVARPVSNHTRSRMLHSSRTARSTPQCQTPIQIVCKPGGVLLRDQRIWHAGMPNASDEDRIMLAMMFTAPWYPNDRKFKLPHFAREILEAKLLAVDVQAEYVDEEECAASMHEFGLGMQPSDPNYRSIWEESQKAA
ncbi:hypothetical protein CPB85DRAFT_614914 [Mucidula mucida]|nr:hypothetical protein CPB85DRAFT_614914 [Mucidula mucida]